MRKIQDVGVRGKRVLVRVGFDVPIKNGRVADDFRLRKSLPTLKLLRRRKARIILISHLGRPEGRTPSLSLRPVASRLSSLMKCRVKFVNDCIGKRVTAAINCMNNGDVIMLENLRFYPEEKKNDPEFARAISCLADIYVNDAFSVSHRKHASIYGVAKQLKSYAGLLLQKEVKALNLSRPKRPFIAIIGGSKVHDKIGVLKKLVSKSDAVLIGGAMMFTFLKACKFEVGKSLVDMQSLRFAKSLLRKRKVILPVDCVISKTRVVPVDRIPKNARGLDIGPETVRIYSGIISRAKTLFWNGPVGLVEKKPFDRGTMAIARAIVSSGSHSIVGGGDSVAVIRRAKLEKKFSHVSTGGGAALEFIEGRRLPGLQVLG